MGSVAMKAGPGLGGTVEEYGTVVETIGATTGGEDGVWEGTAARTTGVDEVAPTGTGVSVSSIATGWEDGIFSE